MSVPVKESITQIVEGAIVAPSIANAPHINLENNIDKILAYLVGNVSDHFDNNTALSAGLVFYYTAGIYAVAEAVYSIIAGNVNLVANSTNYVQINYNTRLVIVNQNGFDSNNLPLWRIVTNGSTTTSVLDRRSVLSSLPQPLKTNDSPTFLNLTITTALTITAGILGITTLNATNLNTVDLTTTGNTIIGNLNTDALTVHADSTFKNALVVEGLSIVQALTVQGNLTVNGTTTSVNSTTITIDDPIFTLGGDTFPVSNDAKDRGIEFRWFDSAARLGFMGWDNSVGKFILAKYATNTNEIFSSITYGDLHIQGLQVNSVAKVTNLNADRVDGIHASTTPIANQLLALNGSSILPAMSMDAAKLGNQLPSYYLDANNFTNVATNAVLVAGNNLLTLCSEYIFRTSNMSSTYGNASAIRVTDATPTGNVIYNNSNNIVSGSLGVIDAGSVTGSVTGLGGSGAITIPKYFGAGTIRIFYALSSNYQVTTLTIKMNGATVITVTENSGVIIGGAGSTAGLFHYGNAFNNASVGRNGFLDVAVPIGAVISYTMTTTSFVCSAIIQLGVAANNVVGVARDIPSTIWRKIPTGDSGGGGGGNN